MQNTVSFKVAGSELSSYIDQIQKKSDVLTSAAIKGAIDQVAKGKEVLTVINEQIKAVEKKNRIEGQAARSIFLENRENDLKRNKEKYTVAANDIYGNTKLSENEKKEKITATAGREKEDEEKIKNNYRENLTVAKETERQSKIQTSLARENVDALRQTAKENVKAIVSGDLKLADVIKGASSDEEKLVAKLTEEGVKSEKKNQQKEGGGGSSIMGGILAVDNINKMISSAGQLASTNNGFDMIQPASSMAGRVIGGIIGGLVGGLATGGLGVIAGAGLGASIGGGLGETIGAFEQKRALGKEEFFKARNRFNAITGGDSEEAAFTEKSGVSITDFIKMQTDVARKRGSAADSMNSTRDMIYADRGYGVDQGTSSNLIEMQRSAKDGNKDLALLIGGVLQKGDSNGIFKNGDHTFLNEFLGKFASLQKELLKTQSNVATGTTMDILTKFNKLGGEWDAKDPRSQGNINNIQSGLANPGTDSLKALSFGILRRQNPNMNSFDLVKEREKGLGSSKYLKGMLEAVDGMGGDDSAKQWQLSGMFPGLSKSAVSRLFKNRSGLANGSMSVDELQSTYKNDFQSRSESNTAPIERNTAEIQNGILKDRYDNITAIGNVLKAAIENSFSGAVININENKGTVTFPTRAAVVQANETKKAFDASDAGKQQQAINLRDMNGF